MRGRVVVRGATGGVVGGWARHRSQRGGTAAAAARRGQRRRGGAVKEGGGGGAEHERGRMENEGGEVRGGDGEEGGGREGGVLRLRRSPLLSAVRCGVLHLLHFGRCPDWAATWSS